MCPDAGLVCACVQSPPTLTFHLSLTQNWDAEQKNWSQEEVVKHISLPCVIVVVIVILSITDDLHTLLNRRFPFQMHFNNSVQVPGFPSYLFNPSAPLLSASKGTILMRMSTFICSDVLGCDFLVNHCFTAPLFLFSFSEFHSVYEN